MWTYASDSRIVLEGWVEWAADRTAYRLADVDADLMHSYVDYLGRASTPAVSLPNGFGPPSSESNSFGGQIGDSRRRPTKSG